MAISSAKQVLYTYKRDVVTILNESGTFKELDENLVDEFVLRDRLNHEHPLFPEMFQHRWNFNFLIVFQTM